MDTAMRDLEHIQERDYPDGPGRRVVMLVLAAGVTVSLVFAMGMLLNDADAVAVAEEHDPLSALDRAAGLVATDDDADAPLDVDRADMRFPETLTEDDRPEVAAALAAAAAEAQHLDPIQPGTLQAPPLLPGVGLIDSIAHSLPAAATAGNMTSTLARAVPGDPLVAASIPRPVGPTQFAPPGMEGLYTLQVISYRSNEEAQAFATSLRARGHQAFVTSADIPDRGMHWRVRIGPFDTMRDAERYRSEFEAEENMNTFVVRRRDDPPA